MTAANKSGSGTAAETLASGETHSFQAEVARLLHLMVHSVYSDTDVFLRELISNAADACDKLRYEALSNPSLLADDPELAVLLTADKAAGTLTVADNGIGMSRAELIDNLGTIARSGTHAFMEKLTEGSNAPKLIGQFGVGFYAAFMVASRVDVVSRRAGSDETWMWSSDGSGTFTVEPYAGDDAPRRGTLIRLTLKEDAKPFLEPWKIEQIVRAYSDHVAIPIRLSEVKDGKPTEPRQINTAAALWTRPKADISPEQYKEFFGALAGIYSDPALTIHYRAEGRHEYTVLLCIPSEPPFDLFDPERRGRQKLYVRRVFITDDAEFLPGYLRFVRGIIDSEDMPLNISREMLQNNPLVAQIRKAVTKRVLSELRRTAEQDPDTFAKIWSAYGAVVKEGLYEDGERRDELFDIARFHTTRSEGAMRTLKDYVAAMKPNQTAIYYVTAEDAVKAAAAPQLEGFKARGIEVLLLTDPVDNFWTRTALGFDGKPFRSVTQGAADLAAIPLEKADEKAAEQEQDKSALGTLVAVFKQTLRDAVKDVRLSERLTSSPVCLVADAAGLDRNLERLLAKQTAGAKQSQPILELNPSHPVIAGLARRAKANGVSDELNEAAWLLLDEAYILEGEPVPDPAAFARRLTGVMSKGLAS
ncbi:molecular chaperone HtpG [Rhodoligotrophos defluvii]|uniref:molecular chaperone HtpG n=1 Tax=Rhodoligotrophos defluvii TaxID=2561934 RepID=UPI0010C9E846|nr:molecular chaperone HtpG [Rhodoligotrophos defluvii]